MMIGHNYYFIDEDGNRYPESEIYNLFLLLKNMYLNCI
jgi:hypothetical protein